MKEEKKIDFVFDISSHLQNQIKESKYLKYGAIALIAFGSIVAIGFASKVINYTIGNIKKLKETLKN